MTLMAVKKRKKAKSLKLSEKTPEKVSDKKPFVRSAKKKPDSFFSVQKLNDKQNRVKRDLNKIFDKHHNKYKNAQDWRHAVIGEISFVITLLLEGQKAVSKIKTKSNVKGA